KIPYKLWPYDTRQAEFQSAYSLSSLAPRMKWLQEFLTATYKISLWVDPVGRFARLQAAAENVRIWSAPAATDNPLRALRAYLMPEEGGVAQQPFRDLVRLQVVPWDDFPQQLRLPG